MEVVKEITVTEAFKSLSGDLKKCQTHESFEDCMSTQLLNNIRENCFCLPYELKSFSKLPDHVKAFVKHYYYDKIEIATN